MNFTTIKLDKTTLPEDGQWVEFANYATTNAIGQYSDKEETLRLITGKMMLITSTYAWKPLAIKWQFHEWLERREGLCSVKGYDRFDNEFFANAVMSCGEIEDVSDIEYNGK